MPTNNMIDRTSASGLIPDPVTREIIQGAVEGSAVLQMGRRLPDMTAKVQSMNVLDMLPMAYWVDGDNGVKQTTRMAWNKKRIYAEELAVIVPIPEAVLADSNYDIWGEVRPRLQEAFGKKIDEAILFGTDKPSSWRDGIVPSAISVGSAVGQSDNIIADILGVDGLIAKVEESGFLPTGAMGAVKMRAILRGMVDANGNPIFKSTVQGTTEFAIDGTPVTFPMNGAFDVSEALMILGDFNQLVYSIRQDMTYKILDQATIIDPNSREVIYSLAQQDMVALRAVMRLGWEIPNPISAFNADNANRFPFAAYIPASNTTLGTIDVQSANSTATYWGHTVSDLQTNVSVNATTKAITGTLKYVSTGALATDWGAGNFIALKFSDPMGTATKIKVGLSPSRSSGLVELDSDMDAVLKVTDKNSQVLKVVSSDGVFTKTDTYSLSGLTCEDS